jgi:hypothetical protein
MKNSEKLRKIIASFSAVADYTQIKVNRTIKNQYVYEGRQRHLASEIYSAWPDKINKTHIINELFVTIKTAKSILETYNIDPDEEYL